jgi:hypothetical protein
VIDEQIDIAIIVEISEGRSVAVTIAVVGIYPAAQTRREPWMS